MKKCEQENKNYYKIQKKTVYIAVCLLVVHFIGLLFVGTILVENTKKMSADITVLKSQMSFLMNEDVKNIFEEQGYNCLYLGNSITKHPINEYWWEESGMAASEIQLDYVHLTDNFLTGKFGKVNSYVLNFGAWELQYYDRAETFMLIEDYLSEYLNLVIIQLGENITETSTLERDYVELIQYIKEKCPKAQVIMIGNFWQNDIVENIKLAVVSETKIDYVDLSEIWNKPEYQAGLGTTVLDENGIEHIIEHEGVAIHPGDLGMSFIADKIFEKIK